MMTVVPPDRQPPGSSTPAEGRRRLNLTGIISAAAGLALFAWYVWSIGPDDRAEIVSDLRAIGWGFAAIIVITGARFALRTVAWRHCLEPAHALPFRTAFAAVIGGDALGNLTPFGLIASEPTKAALIRHRVALGSALTALAIENIAYTLSALAMIAASTVALLLTFQLPPAVSTVARAGIAVVAVCFAVAGWLLWQRPALISRALSTVVPASSRLHAQVMRLHDLESQIYTFAARRPEAIAPLALAEAGFHALGVAEIYLTWWLIEGAPPALLTAFIVEGATRLITVVFKFVPLQLGVGEVTTGGFTQLIGFGATVGTSLSIVRKARMVFWVLAGTIVFVRRQLRP
jgi:hypothetical protein